MPHFVTRVELHAANESHYQDLHNRMAAQGFTRHITAQDGKHYELPPAMYYTHKEATVENVRQTASNCAAATGRTYGVIVTQGASAWAGLAEVARR